MGIRLITFDVHNTILRVAGTPWGNYVKVAADHGVYLEHGKMEKVYPLLWKEWKQKLPDYGTHAGMTPKQWWMGFVSRVLKDSGYHGNEEKLDGIREEIWWQFKIGNFWEPYQETRKTLETLKSRGVAMGIVSNLDERLETVLTNHKLDQYFSFLVTSATMNTSKPDPAMFKAALDISGTVAKESAHVGNDIKEDYIAARDCGLNAFLVDRYDKISDTTHPTIHREHIIKNLIDLTKKLQY